MSFKKTDKMNLSKAKQSKHALTHHSTSVKKKKRIYQGHSLLTPFFNEKSIPQKVKTTSRSINENSMQKHAIWVRFFPSVPVPPFNREKGDWQLKRKQVVLFNATKHRHHMNPVSRFHCANEQTWKETE
mmetsp:Transcript_39985/g.78816  ORF Transcript_39985/g.78816 Transcript_39985/m.78816 type:complete len:129 (+) Transcript_39985:996-1382(+)